MGFELGVFLTFGGALILIFILGKALLVPLKVILRIILNSIVGAVVLIILRFLGTNFGMLVPVNILNSFIVGVLGLPGVIMIILFCNI